MPRVHFRSVIEHNGADGGTALREISPCTALGTCFLENAECVEPECEITTSLKLRRPRELCNEVRDVSLEASAGGLDCMEYRKRDIT